MGRARARASAKRRAAGARQHPAEVAIRPSGARDLGVHFFILDTIVTTQIFDLYPRQLKKPLEIGVFELSYMNCMCIKFSIKSIEKRPIPR